MKSDVMFEPLLYFNILHLLGKRLEGGVGSSLLTLGVSYHGKLVVLRLISSPLASLSEEFNHGVILGRGPGMIGVGIVYYNAGQRSRPGEWTGCRHPFGTLGLVQNLFCAPGAISDVPIGIAQDYQITPARASRNEGNPGFR